MEKQMKQFIVKFFCEDKESSFHTHTSMITPMGKLHVDVHNIEDFWYTYNKYVYVKDGDVPPVIGVTEKPQKFLPVLGDIDIKLKESDIDLSNYNTKLYTEDQLREVVGVYQSTIRNIINDCTDNKLMCVVLEKNLYKINGYVKGGFHIHFPYLFVSKMHQEMHLVPRLQELLTEMDTFENLGITDSSSVLDKNYTKAPWLLYGSRKSVEMDPYLFSKVYDCNCEEIGLEEAFSDYNLYNCGEERIKVRGRVKELLPRILSIVPSNRQESDVKKGLKSPLQLEIKNVNRKQFHKHLKVTVEEAITIASEILPMINDSRAEDYNDWMMIGWALYNIGEGSSQALDLWMEFSQRSEDAFDESKCIYEWSKMRSKNVTLGTLRHFANTDSPEQYSKYKSDQCQKRMKDSVKGSHNAIAKMLHDLYGNEFMCSSYLENTWYQFVGNIWEEIENGVYLRERLSNEIVCQFELLIEQYYKEANENPDRAMNDESRNKLKQVQRVIDTLGSSPFKNNVMTEAKEIFYDKNFKEKLNKDAYLIAFKNGVYDLHANIFRDGRPEDYLSKCLPFEYKEYKDDDEAVIFVHDFLEKIFPDLELRRYFFDIYSDIFVGGNSMKKVFIWSGGGDNGKSVLQTLFDKMLGPLGVKFDTKMFSGKKAGAGTAEPERARAAPPVRLVTADEPDNNETFHTGLLKSLSGNDSFWARDLYQKGKEAVEVVPFFMMNIICNKLPGLDNADAATFNRIRVFPFESVFLDEDHPDLHDSHAEQLRTKKFAKDEKFSEKIPSMVPAFAWVLLEHRKTLKTRIEPDKVKRATEQYRVRTDTYRQYLTECIVEEPGKYISLLEIWDSYKNWYREGFSATLTISKDDIRVYFTKMWEDNLVRTDKWEGYRIKTLADDEDLDNELDVNSNRPEL
ncbi:MAG: phage/plasmid primase, P4 family [Promethearchaeota archaeon]|jgi:P4 family phage/plasmid primase-like protien